MKRLLIFPLLFAISINAFDPHTNKEDRAKCDKIYDELAKALQSITPNNELIMEATTAIAQATVSINLIDFIKECNTNPDSQKCKNYLQRQANLQIYKKLLNQQINADMEVKSSKILKEFSEKFPLEFPFVIRRIENEHKAALMEKIYNTPQN